VTSANNYASVVASTEPPSEDGGENGRLHRGHREARRFNGAAVRRRRRAVTDRGLSLDLGASTEPPSEDGGEVGRLVRITMHLAALQRSRRPKTAESLGCARRGRLGRGSFNGAAVRRRRRAR